MTGVEIHPEPRTWRAARRPDPQTLSVCVTGGAGFVGSHLCDALVGSGHDVTCLDNFHTGRPENVAHLAAAPGFELVDHDVRDVFSKDLRRFDRIYNLACPASPVHYQADRVMTALVCAQGALNVLERASRDDARVFQASTSEIYGDPDVHPQQEGYWGNVNPVGPRSCYDEGKRFAETLFTDFGAERGVDVRIVRIFNTYGPRMRADDGRVVSNFITQALSDQPLTVNGDGSQTRSFCYVDDLVNGFLRLMENTNVGAGPVNLGNPEETTVAEIAAQIIALTGSRSEIVSRPLPVDDPRRRRPDISRARDRLGWSPTVALADGLARTIAFFSAEAGTRPHRFAPAPTAVVSGGTAWTQAPRDERDAARPFTLDTPGASRHDAFL